MYYCSFACEWARDKFSCLDCVIFNVELGLTFELASVEFIKCRDRVVIWIRLDSTTYGVISREYWDGEVPVSSVVVLLWRTKCPFNWEIYVQKGVGDKYLVLSHFLRWSTRSRHLKNCCPPRLFWLNWNLFKFHCWSTLWFEGFLQPCFNNWMRDAQEICKPQNVLFHNFGWCFRRCTHYMTFENYAKE